MALPYTVVEDLHNLGERLKRKERLTQADEDLLHNYAQQISKSDLTKAIKILLKHDPNTKKLREVERERKYATWAELSEAEKQAIIEKRKSATSQSRNLKRVKELAEKEEKKAELELLLSRIKELDLSPLFTHYYEKGENNRGIPYTRLSATTCVLLSKEGTPISRGIALVSFLDNGSKLEGRLIAIERAEKAFIEQRNSLPIYRWEADDVINGVDDYLGECYYKAEYGTFLISDIEDERITKRYAD